MASVVVLGLQWGDEGKGKIVDLLTEQADCTARFQGGHNAGHTLVIDNITIALRLIPSGIMRSNSCCLIGNGVVLDCEALLSEIAGLERQGISVKDRLFISDGCPLILPSHVALDEARENATDKPKIGTTKRGIGPAYEDKVARRAIHLADLFDEKYTKSKLASLLDYHNFILTQYHHAQAIDYEKTCQQLFDHRQQLLPMITNVAEKLRSFHNEGKNILFEGAQGTLLDIDHGTYPFVTSSNTSIGGVATGTGFVAKPAAYVLGVAKAYTTRVGAGPFPTQLDNETGIYLGEKGQEFGTNTGRKRACGWFDAVLMKHAIQLNGVDGLCLTKIDVLDELKEIKVCVAYQTSHGQTSIAPHHAHELEHCHPIYETVPGWEQSTAGIMHYDDLPENAKNYIQYLEKLLKTPVTMISTSPERKHSIILQSPFE